MLDYWGVVTKFDFRFCQCIDLLDFSYVFLCFASEPGLLLLGMFQEFTIITGGNVFEAFATWYVATISASNKTKILNGTKS